LLLLLLLLLLPACDQAATKTDGTRKQCYPRRIFIISNIGISNYWSFDH
jgi:hypothetical protein